MTVTHAITVRLPWAAAIRAGHKRVENRARPIPDKYVGTRVGIHAGTEWSVVGEQDNRINTWWWGRNHHGRRPVATTDFPGLWRNVIAVVRISGCHQRMFRGRGNTDLCCQPWGDAFYKDPLKPAWHITFDDVVALAEPVGPVRGSLTVPWALPDDVAADVTARFQAAP